MKQILDTSRAQPGPARDEQLSDAADVVRDALEQEFYTPPLPVAIVRPEKRPEWARDLRSTTWIVREPAAIPGFAQDAVRLNNAEEGLDFPINSIVVDNFTSGWLLWHEVGVWIPPFNYGRVFRFDGSHKAYVRYETPPGLTAAAPVVNQAQRARVIFHNELLPETSGLALPAADR